MKKKLLSMMLTAAMVSGMLACHGFAAEEAGAEVTEFLQEENELYIHFHRVSDILKAKEFPEAWQGNIRQIKVIRKPAHDFDPHNQWGAGYQGAVPYFRAVGVYRDILVEYWNENEINMEKVSEQYGFSVSHFYRIFTAYTGMTFSRYLTDRRVAAAKRILSTNKEDSIIDIGAQAGFKSVSSFNRIFKQKTGKTPSEYRDAHKET